MKLSDAIELGSTMIEEVTETYYVADSCEGCALGAAWVAAGKTRGLHSWMQISKLFPIGNLLLTESEAEIMGRSTLGPLAFDTSALHSDGTPRLELARRIRLIEELHLEIPGYEPQEEPKNEQQAQTVQLRQEASSVLT